MDETLDPKSDEAYERAAIWHPPFLKMWEASTADIEAKMGISHAEGGWWYEAPVRLKCLWGRHHTQTSALLDGCLVERCSCGATRHGDLMWIRLDPFPWRKLFRSH